jgi:hypothetical protein
MSGENVTPEWLRTLEYAARASGYTAYLVRRRTAGSGQELVVTINPLEGDTILARKTGRNGLYVDDADAPDKNKTNQTNRKEP